MESKKKQSSYMKKYRASKRLGDQNAETINAGKEIFQGTSNKNIGFYMSQFHEVIFKGALYICTCCDQLWYKHSMFNVEKLRSSHLDFVKCLCNKISVDSIERVCRTCCNHLVKHNVPPCAVVNDMVFPEKPEFFDLNMLEWRLLAPRKIIAFQKLMQAPRGKQLKIHGNIVSVQADVMNTVTLLPRTPSETGTIKVNLRRKLQFKSSAVSLNIRPHKVVEAAHWFISKSKLPVCRDDGTSLHEDWETTYNEQILQCIGSDNRDDHPCDKQSIPNEQSDNNTSSKADVKDNYWTEGEEGIPAGVTDTMLSSADFLENSECHYILNVVPAEGNRPLSVFKDQYSEELAYPSIFLGMKRPELQERKVKVHCSEIFKSEHRWSDRRTVICVENIFFKAKKLQIKIILGKSNISHRK